MRGALERFQVVGVSTNTEFLARLVACEAFASADLDTGLIERNRALLVPAPPVASDEVLALAALAELLAIERRAKERAAASGDPCSPWGACDGWRLNQDNHHILVFRQGCLLYTSDAADDLTRVELGGGRIIKE